MENKTTANRLYEIDPCYQHRYALLTLVIFAPLVLTFITLNNFFPVPVWSLFSESVDLRQGTTYYVLRGVKENGEELDIPPIKITNGLAGRIHTMVGYVISNASYTIDSPHPDNVQQITKAGGVDKIPRAARIQDLLKSWGTSYNAVLLRSSPDRLRAIRLDGYRWAGEKYGNYDQPVESWQAKL